MERRRQRSARESRSNHTGRTSSGKGGGIPILLIVILILFLSIFYVIDKTGQGGSSSHRKAPERSSKAEETFGKEGKVSSREKVHKTYFTREEWEGVRGIAEKARKLMIQVQLAYESGDIDLEERKKRNREVEKLFDEAYAEGIQLLKRVPEEEESRFQSYGTEIRSWILKKKRLVR